MCLLVQKIHQYNAMMFSEQNTCSMDYVVQHFPKSEAGSPAPVAMEAHSYDSHHCGNECRGHIHPRT